MKLTTPVEIKALSKRFESNVKIAAIGSCFADEIGELLIESEIGRASCRERV